MSVNAADLKAELVTIGILEGGLKKLPGKARMSAMLTCYEWDLYDAKKRVDPALIDMVEGLWSLKSKPEVQAAATARGVSLGAGKDGEVSALIGRILTSEKENRVEAERTTQRCSDLAPGDPAPEGSAPTGGGLAEGKAEKNDERNTRTTPGSSELELSGTTTDSMTKNEPQGEVRRDLQQITRAPSENGASDIQHQIPVSTLLNACLEGIHQQAPPVMHRAATSHGEQGAVSAPAFSFFGSNSSPGRPEASAHQPSSFIRASSVQQQAWDNNHLSDDTRRTFLSTPSVKKPVEETHHHSGIFWGDRAATGFPTFPSVGPGMSSEIGDRMSSAAQQKASQPPTNYQASANAQQTLQPLTKSATVDHIFNNAKHDRHLQVCSHRLSLPAMY